MNSAEDAWLATRARAIKLVACDWTGVLGDSGVHEQLSLRDGLAVASLRKAGIRTAIISSDPSTQIARNAEAFGSPHVFVGVKDKAARLEMIADDADISLAAIAYIGADAVDAGIMRTIAEVGLTGAPRGAAEEIAALAHFQSDRSGGSGAFREFADWILKLRSF
jgi:3-deoxy-D-manno-octulosonate 8-phosphate phosphatase (KDO 8-P phosphatase)